MEGTFAFVILHYLAVEDTVECIESIKKFAPESKIIVVDNASPDGSGKDLKEKYNKDSQVVVILNNKNDGFSKGNNKGISYAKNHLNSDFVIVMNNDTVMIQQEFTKIIKKEYEDTHFAVMGPMVIDPDGMNNSNPLWDGNNKTTEELKAIYLSWRKQYIKAILGLSNYHPFAMNQEKKDEGLSRLPTNEKKEDIQLHGCCLVFSPVFFHRFSGFEELTFMYGEESILKMNCDKYGLLMIYNPELKIYHKEAVATKKVYNSKRKKITHYKRAMEAAKAIYIKAKNNSLE